MAVAVFSDIRKIDIIRLSNFEKYLSYERVEKSKKYRRDEDYKSNICAALLLRSLLCENFRLKNSDLEFEISPFGKPFLKNCGIGFSISHSKDYVSCIVGGTFCGTDVEFSGEIDPEKMLRHFEKGEREFILNNSDKEERKRLFFRLWTMKESYLKATGKGLSGGLDSFCVRDFEMDHPEVCENPDLYTLCFEHEGYTLSFLSEEEFKPEFISGKELLLRAEKLEIIR